MLRNQVQSDITTAQEICKKLISGEKDAILGLYHIYHPLFLNFAQKYLYDPGNTDDVLSEFWIELLNGKAICAYEGRNNASLRVYLLKILKWRIIDENRKKRTVTTPESPSEPEHEAQKRRREKLIYEALLLLAKISKQDANLVRMHLEGLTYKEMAEKEMAGQNPDPKKVETRTNAIRKQFKRPNSGSMAKFSLITERLKEKYGWDYSDLL